MLLVDDLAAGGTKNLRHTPRGLVTLSISPGILHALIDGSERVKHPDVVIVGILTFMSMINFMLC